MASDNLNQAVRLGTKFRFLNLLGGPSPVEGLPVLGDQECKTPLAKIEQRYQPGFLKFALPLYQTRNFEIPRGVGVAVLATFRPVGEEVFQQYPR
jgi:hypothetical protein